MYDERSQGSDEKWEIDFAERKKKFINFDRLFPPIRSFIVQTIHSTFCGTVFVYFQETTSKSSKFSSSQIEHARQAV
jgi:hypothetical protein